MEKSDVVEKFRYSSGEHFVLRSMDEMITVVPKKRERSYGDFVDGF